MPQFPKIISTLALLGILICPLAGADVTKSDSNQEKTIVVTSQKPEFTISLDSNPTTGYSWLAKDYDTALVTVVKHTYHPPIRQIVGAGGIDTWTFRVDPKAFSAPHVLKIKMLYARPWNIQDNSKEMEFTVVTQQ